MSGAERPPAIVALVLAPAFVVACAAPAPPLDFAHDIALDADGSGSITVSGDAWMWTAFKKIGDPANPDATVTESAVRSIFERAGLDVTDVSVRRNEERVAVSASASFQNLNQVGGTVAFPDLLVQSTLEGQRRRIAGVWRRPPGSTASATLGRDGDVLLRLWPKTLIHDARDPSRVQGQGVEWRTSLGDAVAGRAIDFGAILGTARETPDWVRTAIAGIAVLVILGSGLLYFVWKRPGRSGRRAADDSPESDFSKYDPTSPA